MEHKKLMEGQIKKEQDKSRQLEIELYRQKRWMEVLMYVCMCVC